MLFIIYYVWMYFESTKYVYYPFHCSLNIRNVNRAALENSILKRDDLDYRQLGHLQWLDDLCHLLDDNCCTYHISGIMLAWQLVWHMPSEKLSHVITKTRADHLQSWHLLADGWHLSVESWHLSAESWHLLAESWHLSVESWHLSAESWHLSAESWNLSAESWHFSSYMSAVISKSPLYVYNKN